jgi:hypothetical protein
MKKKFFITESEKKEIINLYYKSNKNKENISESLQDYLPLITGTIGSILAIKLFGKKILLEVFGLIVKSFANNLCKKRFDSLTDLLIKNPEKLKIEYRKIKDYYQIVIDLRVISSEFSKLDLDKLPMNQLQSDNFPAKFKFYENGDVEYYCIKSIKKNFGFDIYEEVSEFIKKYGEENTSLRGHGEEKLVYEVLYKNLKIKNKLSPWGRVSTNDEMLKKNKIEYDALMSMDSNVVNKSSNEISKKIDIPEDIIKTALMSIEPNEQIGNSDYVTGKEETLWDYVNKVYKEIIKHDKK